MSRNKRVPDIEDLLRQIELDEIAADVTKSKESSGEGGGEESSSSEKRKECSEDDEDCHVDEEYVPDWEIGTEAEDEEGSEE